MTALPELAKVIGEIPIFSELDVNEARQITPLFEKRSYRKGEIIFREHESGDEFYIVKSGVVRIYRIEDSREMILSIFGAGDYFGEMAVLESDGTRSATAQMMESGELYILRSKDLYKLLEQRPALTLKLLQTALSRIRKTNEMIMNLTTLDARSRITKTILELADTYGVDTGDGTRIELKLTHQQLADMTNTVRETVTKTLLELQQDALIRIDHKRITVCDRDILNRRIRKQVP